MLNGHEISEGQIESVGSLVAEEETEQFEFTVIWRIIRLQSDEATFLT